MSVIVVSYNTRELLLDCVASAVESAAEIPVEVLVVDNGSSDGSAEAVQTAFPAVRLIINEVNLGFGAACNQGIRSTTAPQVLLLNSDARLNGEALARMMDCMASRPECGAAGCSLVDGGGRPSVSARHFLNPFNQALELLAPVGALSGRFFSRTARPRFDADRVDCSTDWLEASCLLLRRAALDETGLFDDRFFMYSEDEDLCYRLREKGWSICLVGAAECVHLGGGSSEPDREALLLHFYRSQIDFLLKHRGKVPALMFEAAMTASLMMKGWGLKLRGEDDRADAYRARRLAFARARRAIRNRPAHTDGFEP